MAEPDSVEIRVVACLIEKQRTTPDVYPLSLNSLRVACNQSTNRDPVVDYDEATVIEAPAAAGAARLDPAGQRAGRPRAQVPPPARRGAGARPGRALPARRPHAARRADAGRAEAAQRAPAPLRRSAAVHETLERLVERGLVARHPRRPGQKEERYEQLLGGHGGAAAACGLRTSAGSTGGPARATRA